jgi:hypothetical protein
LQLACRRAAEAAGHARLVNGRAGLRPGNSQCDGRPSFSSSPGRIFNAAASPVGSLWMWTLTYGEHENRTPTHGYEATREAAMAAFAKSWRRE